MHRYEPVRGGVVGWVINSAAEQILNNLIALSKRKYVSAHDIATIYVALGDTDAASITNLFVMLSGLFTWTATHCRPFFE